MEQKWACQSCGHPYNKLQVEGTLVGIVQRRSLSYQLQDLKCSTCSQIKAENMGDFCQNCTGKWVCKESKQAFLDSMQVFQNIAKYHKMEWLKEVVEWVAKN
eukprot:TRINITY_DN11946_c0_g1_i1.p1 TRINITY_DN11946_c0_g1~~TRINITY_DN11946_c0_g1_i1.p1  ORF type:complete len:102 (+),score=23.62 TRINITY_DN11946_c0_g1_i1:200-505(+)